MRALTLEVGGGAAAAEAMMHLLTPAPRRWPDPRSSGVGHYIDDTHGLIHDPVASAIILMIRTA